jgi:hypothetical protein
MLKRVKNAFKRHPAIAWTSTGVVIAAAAFVLVWFQPHKIFIEQTVDEAIPRVPATADSDPQGDETEPEMEPMTLLMGDFQRLEHPASGTASILELDDGTRFLRFEDLDTSNGPDLRVYLTEIPASDDWFAYGERFVDLGPLKGNKGDQNYALPKGLELSPFKSAVIWCRRFTVGFAVAPLDQA